MKFIYIVRTPVDRIISSYMHTYERGYINKSIEEAIREDHFLISTSRYYIQILPYVTRFSRDKVLILDFDDLLNDRRELVRRTASFLGVDFDKFGDFESTHKNASLSQHRKHHRFDNPPWHLRVMKTVAPAYWEKLSDNSSRTFVQKPELGKEYREVIARLLLPGIKPLEELMGKDLSAWYEGVPERPTEA